MASLRYALALVAGMAASTPAFAEEPPTGSTPKCETITDVYIENPATCPPLDTQKQFCTFFKAAIAKSEAKSTDKSLPESERKVEETSANNLKSALASFGCEDTTTPPPPERRPQLLQDGIRRLKTGDAPIIK